MPQRIQESQWPFRSVEPPDADKLANQLTAAARAVVSADQQFSSGIAHIRDRPGSAHLARVTAATETNWHASRTDPRVRNLRAPLAIAEEVAVRVEQAKAIDLDGIVSPAQGEEVHLPSVARKELSRNLLTIGE